MFTTVIKKIEEAPILSDPFPHVEVFDVFSDEVFANITSSPEIKFKSLGNDRELVDTLETKGWKPIPFPGTTENIETYLKWREKGGKVLNTNTCEGFGITYRLFQAFSPVITELKAFLESDAFKKALTDKFGIALDTVTYDAGIQKYLDGYEISPHPDIRRKALTYMVNINPATNSEALNYHTHYMTFDPKWRYVGAYWEHNLSSERCWVPWDWCTSRKQQVKNNSMVIFSPSHNTLHAVKAHYDHLPTQRTQLYGNFWYENPAPITLSPDWEHYVIGESAAAKLKRHVPDSVRKRIKILTGRGSANAGKRAVRV